MDELATNLKEVIERLIEEGEPKLEAEFVPFFQISFEPGTQNL